MSDNSSTDRSRNKSIIVNNKLLFKQYAAKNCEIFGPGIIIVNLLLFTGESLDELNVLESIDRQEPTVHQPISYIPQANFWFKTLGLKIKKKYQIDLKAEDNVGKFLIVFIKDASIQHFSIYSIELESSKNFSK